MITCLMIVSLDQGKTFAEDLFAQQAPEREAEDLPAMPVAVAAQQQAKIAPTILRLGMAAALIHVFEARLRGFLGS